MEKQKFNVGDYAHTPRGFIGRVMVRKESDSDVIVYVETKNGVGNGWYREYDLKVVEDNDKELDDFIKVIEICEFTDEIKCPVCPYNSPDMKCVKKYKENTLKFAKELKQLRAENKELKKKKSIGDNNLLVVRANVFDTHDAFNKLHEYIVASRKTGVVLLPPYCEAIVVPGDVEIKVENGGDKK